MSHRKSRSDTVITPELARALCEVSHDIQRQVALLIDRKGRVRFTVVGDGHSVHLPLLTAWRQSENRLLGLRMIHTHLDGQAIDEDDLTDLALLRLDWMAAIEVTDEGLPGAVYQAHLLPANEEERPWELLSPRGTHELDDKFSEVIAALEEEFARNRMPRQTNSKGPRALLVHVSTATPTDAADSMAELRELAMSAGISATAEIIQRRSVHPKFVLGKGRLKETAIKALQLGTDIVIFDLNLHPSQVKGLADFTDLKILDRTQLILDIFAQRAVTREGKIQVELAQLRYLLPRLGAKHTALSRLTGGIGGRGPGETKLEVDRRRAQKRVTQLQREIRTLGKRRSLRRQRRSDRNVPTVSIVGYTNAGKSTLLNKLTNSQVVAKDVLFATLNPVSRRLRLPKDQEVIITDTVGFIHNLPSELLDAFRTTFEEMEPSDLLLLVLDASDARIAHHYEMVRSQIRLLELDHKPCLVVLNKIDLCEEKVVQGLAKSYNAIAVSAMDSSTFGPLLEAIRERLKPKKRVASSDSLAQ